MAIDGGKCSRGTDFSEMGCLFGASHIDLYKQICEIKLDWQIIIGMVTCD